MYKTTMLVDEKYLCFKNQDVLFVVDADTQSWIFYTYHSLSAGHWFHHHRSLLSPWKQLKQ